VKNISTLSYVMAHKAAREQKVLAHRHARYLFMLYIEVQDEMIGSRGYVDGAQNKSIFN
jgi:hypothetical protein